MISNFEISLSPHCQPSRPQIHHTVARAVKSRMKFQKDWMAWAAVERIVMKRGPTTASGPSQKRCYRFLSWPCVISLSIYMMDGVRWDDIFSEWQATCGIHCEIVPIVRHLVRGHLLLTLPNPLPLLHGILGGFDGELPVTLCSQNC